MNHTPESQSPHSYLEQTHLESQNAREVFVKECSESLIAASHLIAQSLCAGGKVLICGNGGSAADSQHLAAEMVGRMILERKKPLPAIALTTDTSNLTALANDYSFEQIFARQVQALGRDGDVLIAISTSGNSPNVVAAVTVAKQLGCKVISLTGGTGGKLASLSDVTLNVSAGRNSSRIQETHIFAIHSLVDLLDRFFLPVTE